MLRFRFSVRTLAIFLTLLCAYLSAWETTKRHAMPDRLSSEEPFNNLYYDPFSPRFVYEPTAIMPFVVRYHEVNCCVGEWDVYYIWLFGPKIKLFESVAPNVQQWRTIKAGWRFEVASRALR